MVSECSEHLEQKKLPVMSPLCLFCGSSLLSNKARNLSRPTVSVLLPRYRKLLARMPVTPITNEDAARHGRDGCSGAIFSGGLIVPYGVSAIQGACREIIIFNTESRIERRNS